MSERYNYHDALEAQFDLFKFWRSDIGRRYAEFYLKDRGVGSPLRHGLEPIPNYEKYVSGEHKLQDVEASKVLLADPVYVTEEMFTVAEAAADMFKPEPLEATDLITEAGFVLLPRPFVAPDINGIDTTWRAFTWMPCQSPDGKPGIHFSTYTHRDDWSLDGYPIQDSPFVWQPLHIQPWWFGEEAPEELRGDGWWQKCQAMLRLMMQHVAVREEHQPPRATRKRWKRETRDERDRYIVVVRLRRPKHKPTGETRDIDWTHRWIVGGHWRNQPYSSLGIVRQIWISPHMKGPDDKPLVIRKARAFELVQ